MWAGWSSSLASGRSSAVGSHGRISASEQSPAHRSRRLRCAAPLGPDVVIVDIKMPPTHTDEGLVAAQEIRAAHPDIGVLVLSHYLQSHYAMRLIEQHPGGVGYLLKERVSGVGVLADALARVHEGECVVDPTIVARLLRRARPASPPGQLTEREHQVLALMAEGRSNRGICERLLLSPKTVEGHVKNVFLKLGVGESADDHRRVLAVLTYLRSAHQQQA